MNAMNDDPLYTVNEVRNRLRLSLSTVYALVSRGELRAYKLGPSGSGIRISESQIQEYLKSRETGLQEVANVPLKHLH